MKPQAYIQTLIDQLSESSKDYYSKILNNFDFSKVDFSNIENWILNSYTRNCFYCDERFELILICWGKNQKTLIHDHDGEDCWVYLLEGEMEEDIYQLNNDGELRLSTTKILKPNQITKSDEHTGFHRLRNSFEGKSMSLHLYAKPIVKSRTFDENLGELIERKLSYDSYSPLRPFEKIN